MTVNATLSVTVPAIFVLVAGVAVGALVATGTLVALDSRLRELLLSGWSQTWGTPSKDSVDTVVP
jgi:hypothetical protein